MPVHPALARVTGNSAPTAGRVRSCPQSPSPGPRHRTATRHRRPDARSRRRVLARRCAGRGTAPTRCLLLASADRYKLGRVRHPNGPFAWRPHRGTGFTCIRRRSTNPRRPSVSGDSHTFGARFSALARVHPETSAVNPPICGHIWRFAKPRVQSGPPVPQLQCVPRTGFLSF